jgi:hypothetical protein
MIKYLLIFDDWLVYQEVSRPLLMPCLYQLLSTFTQTVFFLFAKMLKRMGSP